MKTDFETFWREIVVWLSSRQRIITNWTKFHEHEQIGEKFEAEYKNGDYILAYPEPPAKVQRIPKEDFKIIYDKWEEYTKGILPRSYFVHGPIAKSRFTKYTISIIHEYINQR